MDASLITIFLPTGQALALTPAELATALRRGEELGLALGGAAKSAPTPPRVAGHTSGEWVDARELARRTGTDARLWRSRAKAGELPHRRVGRRILFPASVLQPEEPRATAPAAGGPEEVIPWKR